MLPKCVKGFTVGAQTPPQVESNLEVLRHPNIPEEYRSDVLSKYLSKEGLAEQVERTQQAAFDAKSPEDWKAMNVDLDELQELLRQEENAVADQKKHNDTLEVARK